MFYENITLHTLDEVCICPAIMSSIRHRSECNPYVDGQDNKLPIFTAPMDAVVNEKNYETFINNGITPIIPRTVDINLRMYLAIHHGQWIAVGLEEFETFFTKPNHLYNVVNGPDEVNVLIDIANGNMSYLFELIKAAKAFFTTGKTNINIMVGNVANPLTYRELSKLDVWGVRVSVGSGACCITASNTGVHYPMASLIADCIKMKKKENSSTRIIADGGISNYARAIKALALGADYVMMGTALVKAEESAAEIFTDTDGVKHKTVYGMSTKTAQRKINPDAKLHTSEGIERIVKVEYTLPQWVENFTDYLRSAMSYCDVNTLKLFTTQVDTCIMSPTAQSVINS